jgi:hypothetical protein
MFHKKQNSKDRGSMLFLAMVVMGIMLVLGVGVATLLVRQIRESGVSEKTAVAFYVKETALDGFSVLDTWTDITWSGVEEKLEYKVTENEEEHDVAVRIEDDNYYFFGKEDEGGGSSGGDSGGDSEEARRSFYYSNPNGWGSVEMMYGLFDETGNNPGGWPRVVMTPSEYSGWKVYELPDEIGSDIKEIRIGFIEEGGSIWDSTYYLYKNEGADSYFYYYDVFFSTYDKSSKRRSFYYSNPNGWGSVEMMYGLFDETGNNPGGWPRVVMTPSEYSGWKVYELPDEIGSDIKEIRIGFIEEGGSIWDSTYYLYKNEGAEGRFNYYEKMFSPFE